MNNFQKNQLGMQPNDCEQRVMLMGANPGFVDAGTPPGVVDGQQAAVDGTVPLVVSGDKTFAIVPTQDSRVGRSDDAQDRIRSRLRRNIDNGVARSVRAATAVNSQGGTQVTANESSRIDNAAAAIVARTVGGAAYVGQTGSNRLSRIGDGPLPSGTNGGTRANLFALGFDESAFGSAENASELPDQLLLNSNTVDSLTELRRDSREQSVGIGIGLNQGGEIDDVSFPLIFSDGFDPSVPSAADFDSVSNPSRVTVQTTPQVDRNANNGARFEEVAEFV